MARPVRTFRTGSDPRPPLARFGTANNSDCSDTITYGYHTHVSAALYADGSAFGDRRGEIAQMMSKRVEQEREHQQVVLKVCALAQKDLGLHEIATTLEKEVEEGPARGRVLRNFNAPARTRST
jgi:hypothetical protein